MCMFGNCKSVLAILAAGVVGASVFAFAEPPADGGHDKGKHAEKAGGAKVGEAAPDFKLTDTDGKEHSLSALTKEGKIVVLEWFNPECPFIVKHHKVNTTFNNLYTEFNDDNVVFFAVNSNAEGKPGYGKDVNAAAKKDFAMEYAILLDESGATGRAYGAKTTPHCFIINKEGILAYAGAIDNNNDARTAGDVNYVSQALNQIIKGETVTEPETKAYGCSVKYGAK